jgi:hypothetical protein
MLTSKQIEGKPLNHILSVFVAGLMICMPVTCLAEGGTASKFSDEKSLQNETHGLTLSDMKVKITSQGHTATFQLYDPVAAKEFYDQLPLDL